jgi:hypothetical protein
MIALLISILLSMGVIATESDYHDLSDSDQEFYQETIITEDLTGL